VYFDYFKRDNKEGALGGNFIEQSHCSHQAGDLQRPNFASRRRVSQH